MELFQPIKISHLRRRLGVLSVILSGGTRKIGLSPPYPVVGILPLVVSFYLGLRYRRHGLRLDLDGWNCRKVPRTKNPPLPPYGVDVGVSEEADLAPGGLPRHSRPAPFKTPF